MELLKILFPVVFAGGAVVGIVLSLAGRGTLAEKAQNTWMTVGMPLGMCVGAALGVIWSLLAQGDLGISICLGTSMGMGIGMGIGAAIPKADGGGKE